MAVKHLAGGAGNCQPREQRVPLLLAGRALVLLMLVLVSMAETVLQAIVVLLVLVLLVVLLVVALLRRHGVHR